MIIDIHCHPTIRPYNTGKRITSTCKPITQRDTPIINYSQCDFKKIALSKSQVAFISLYPIEQGFFLPTQLNDSANADTLINLFLKFPIDRINQIQNYNHDYFEDLEREYSFLRTIENKKIRIKKHTYTFKLISNYAELNQILEANKNNLNATTIAIVLTIEGGHALGCGTLQHANINPNDLTNSNTIQLLNKLTNNIQKIKQWHGGNHCPLFLTIAHHFNNLLCGHQISFANTTNKILNQTTYLNQPISELGKQIIIELLSPENGKPIYIDTRHMSIDTKKWYYHYVSCKRTEGIEIPIISSHSAVNGFSTMDKSILFNSTHSDADNKYKTSTTFNNWDINISDDEIILIHKSNGLIGLNFDERIIAGNEQRKICHAKSTKKTWIQPFINNIIHIVNVLMQQGIELHECFTIICIGSDFDGIINPVQKFKTSKDFPMFESTLRNELTKQLVKNYSISLDSSNEQIDKILFKNVLRFVAKNRK